MVLMFQIGSSTMDTQWTCPDVILSSILNDHRDFLLWARREHGLAWDTNTCAVAVLHMNLPLLQWLWENDCLWDHTVAHCGLPPQGLRGYCTMMGNQQAMVFLQSSQLGGVRWRIQPSYSNQILECILVSAFSQQSYYTKCISQQASEASLDTSNLENDPGEEKIIVSIQRKGNIILTVNRKMLTPKPLKRPCERTVWSKMFFSLPQMVEALVIFGLTFIFGTTPFSTDSDDESDNNNDGEKEKTSLSNLNESLLTIIF